MRPLVLTLPNGFDGFVSGRGRLHLAVARRLLTLVLLFEALVLALVFAVGLMLARAISCAARICVALQRVGSLPAARLVQLLLACAAHRVGFFRLARLARLAVRANANADADAAEQLDWRRRRRTRATLARRLEPVARLVGRAAVMRVDVADARIRGRRWQRLAGPIRLLARRVGRRPLIAAASGRRYRRARRACRRRWRAA